MTMPLARKHRLTVYFLIALAICFFTVLSLMLKINFINNHSFQDLINISSTRHHILSPDEVKYVFWYARESDRLTEFFESFDFVNISTNFWGYIIGYLALVFGDIYYIYSLNVFICVLFLLSTYKVLRAICHNRSDALVYFSVIALNPILIALSVSFLRDLFILLVVNLLIISVVKRKYILLFVCSVLIFFTRNFYLVFLFPLLVLLYNLNSSNINKIKTRFIATSVITFLLLSFLIYIRSAASGLDTNFYTFIALFLEVAVGLKYSILNFSTYSNGSLPYYLDISSSLYNFMVMLLLYCLIFIKRKIPFGYLAFLLFAFSLSYVYGDYLGFFAARNKYVLYILLCYLMAIFSSRNKDESYFFKADLK